MKKGKLSEKNFKRATKQWGSGLEMPLFFIFSHFKKILDKYYFLVLK
jgi:hypothetical protein